MIIGPKKNEQRAKLSKILRGHTWQVCTGICVPPIHRICPKFEYVCPMYVPCALDASEQTSCMFKNISNMLFPFKAFSLSLTLKIHTLLSKNASYDSVYSIGILLQLQNIPRVSQKGHYPIWIHVFCHFFIQIVELDLYISYLTFRQPYLSNIIYTDF